MLSSGQGMFWLLLEPSILAAVSGLQQSRPCQDSELSGLLSTLQIVLRAVPGLGFPVPEVNTKPEHICNRRPVNAQQSDSASAAPACTDSKNTLS